MYEDEASEGAKIIFAWILAGGVALGIVWLFFASIYPAIVDNQTHANRASQGYVEAKQGLLLQLVQDYNTLETEIVEMQASISTDVNIVAGKRGQQIAILHRVRSEAALLDPADVPQSVREFLDQHKEE